MDKELIKDIVGRPKWWVVVVPLMAAFVVIASMCLPKDADGAERGGLGPAPAPSSARICPSGEWSCYTAKRFAQDFRNARFGNSRGVELPPRVQRMVDRAMTKRGVANRGDDAWWRDALSFTACIGGPRWTGACRRGQRFVGDLVAETSRITVFCGGLAVIGSLAGGGAWGAGRATGACLWTRLMGVWR